MVLSGKRGPQQRTLESTGLLRGRSGPSQSVCMEYSILDLCPRPPKRRVNRWHVLKLSGYSGLLSTWAVLLALDLRPAVLEDWRQRAV